MSSKKNNLTSQLKKLDQSIAAKKANASRIAHEKTKVRRARMQTLGKVASYMAGQ